MPRGDMTGPWGRGPMTGRGAGYCGGYPRPGFANVGGRGFGLGRGFGGGWRSRQSAWGGPGPGWGPGFYGPVEPYGANPETEGAMLTEAASALQSQLDQVKKRLADLEGENRED